MKGIVGVPVALKIVYNSDVTKPLDILNVNFQN